MPVAVYCFMFIIIIVGLWANVAGYSRMMPKPFRVLNIAFSIIAFLGLGIFLFFNALSDLGYCSESELKLVVICAVPAFFAGIIGCIGLNIYERRFLTVIQFNKIALGMSCDEVVSLIGTPRNSSSADGITTYMWNFGGYRRSTAYRTVFFQDDKVISKLKGAYRETVLGRIILLLIFTPIALLVTGAIAGSFGDVFQVVSAVSLFAAFVLLGVVFVRIIVRRKRLSAGLKKTALGMSYDEIISLAGRPHDSASYNDIVTCVWNMEGIRGQGNVVRAVVFKGGKAVSFLAPD